MNKVTLDEQFTNHFNASYRNNRTVPRYIVLLDYKPTLKQLSKGVL